MKNNKGFSLIETALIILVFSTILLTATKIMTEQVKKESSLGFSKNLGDTYYTFMTGLKKYLDSNPPSGSTEYTCTAIRSAGFLPSDFSCIDELGQTLKARVSFNSGILYSYFVYGEGNTNVSKYFNLLELNIEPQLLQFLINSIKSLQQRSNVPSSINFVLIKNNTTAFKLTQNGFSNPTLNSLFGSDTGFISSVSNFSFNSNNYFIGLHELYSETNKKNKRINLTNATSDYMLQVGEEAYIEFNNTTSKPLRIATQSGTLYEMDIVCSNTGGESGGNLDIIALLPNNTTYSNQFVFASLYSYGGGTGGGYVTTSYFLIGQMFSLSRVIIQNFTQIKNTIMLYNSWGRPNYYPSAFFVTSAWRNTTTAWTSLGTVQFPQNSSGYILVRRLK